MLTKSELEEQYLVENIPPSVIAQEHGLSRKAVDSAISKYGIPRKGRGNWATWNRKGKKGPAWGGGRIINDRGYVFIYMPGHHRAEKSGYVREHIYIWEKFHNKQLPNGWIIHHLNGIKNDNRPRNLQALNPNKHHPYLVSQGKLQKKIRELECEIELLKKALQDSQMIFVLNTN